MERFQAFFSFRQRAGFVDCDSTPHIQLENSYCRVR